MADWYSQIENRIAHNKLKELLNRPRFDQAYCGYGMDVGGANGFGVSFRIDRRAEPWATIPLVLGHLEDDNEELRHFIAEKERDLAEEGALVLRPNKDKDDPDPMFPNDPVYMLDLENGKLLNHLKDLHEQHARTFFRAI